VTVPSGSEDAAPLNATLVPWVADLSGPAFATGGEYGKWLEENDKLHRDLMAKGGLLKK